MSLSPAIKAAMSAESRSLFDGKLACDAAQAAFKANGAFSSETSFESERATYAKGTLTVNTASPSDSSFKAAAHLSAEKSVKTEGYVTAEGSITTKGSVKAERNDTTSVINEQDVAHRFSKAAV